MPSITYTLQELATQVVSILKRKDLTLAIAESATGGFISHFITNVDGSSKVFIGSVVAYSVLVKNDLLDVPYDTIMECGAISPETTEALLKGLQTKLGADLQLAITGVAGSNVIEGKPRGLMYIGIGSHTWHKIEENQFAGTRMEIKEQTARRAFAFLLEELENL